MFVVQRQKNIPNELALQTPTVSLPGLDLHFLTVMVVEKLTGQAPTWITWTQMT